MKTIIEGKNVKTIYEVKSHKNEDGAFTGKPEVVSKQELLGWTKIKTFDEAINFSFIKLDADTIVTLVEKSFRVDLGAFLMKIDTIVSNEEVGKEKSSKELICLLKEYNKQKINEDDKMVAYCKLHNLEPENVDYNLLKDILGSNKKIMSNTVPYVDWGSMVQNFNTHMSPFKAR
jgi:hypothetical protein